MAGNRLRCLQVVALAGALLPGLACGPEIAGGDGARPTVLFDPAAWVIPTPNNLSLEDGRVKIPPQCGESGIVKTVRTQGLNRLDGFGNYKPTLQADFSDRPDLMSLAGRVLFGCRLPAPAGLSVCGLEGGDCDPSPCACTIEVDEIVRSELKNCRGKRKVHTLTVTPVDPLPPGGECGVAILDGVVTDRGEPFLPSASWFLIRQQESPVVLDGGRVVRNSTPLNSADGALLSDFAEAWEKHRPFLDLAESLGFPRENVLLAWEFRPQSTTAPLDLSVPGSAAALAKDHAPLDVIDLAVTTGGAEITTKYQEIWDGNRGVSPPSGTTLCDFLPCQATGAILEGRYTSPRFLQQRDNPGGLSQPATEQWSDPYTPELFDASATVEFLAWFPDPTVRPPPSACGYPMVILGHGYQQMREIWPVLAAHLANAGMASIAINAVNHGDDRAVKIDDSAASGCTGVTSWKDNVECYENILTTNLAISRDNIRQTVLDTMQLARVIAADSIRTSCVAAPFCAGLRVDGTRIGYAGGSMGTIIGTIVAAMTPEIRAAVLNAGGAAWIDVFRDSGSDDIKCGMVDLLIQAGIIEGELWNYGNAAATCYLEDWKRDPRYRTFENMARWLLDPADPANFAGKLGADTARVRVLVQKIVPDIPIPAPTTTKLARLLGWRGNSIPSNHTGSIDNVRPTQAICDAATAGRGDLFYGETFGNTVFIEYNSDIGIPSNLFAHADIASPAFDDTHPEYHGRRQVQADAVAFLAGVLARVPSTCAMTPPACP